MAIGDIDINRTTDISSEIQDRYTELQRERSEKSTTEIAGVLESIDTDFYINVGDYELVYWDNNNIKSFTIVQLLMILEAACLRNMREPQNAIDLLDVVLDVVLRVRDCLDTTLQSDFYSAIEELLCYSLLQGSGPEITFYADSNTGIYTKDSDAVSFSVSQRGLGLIK